MKAMSLRIALPLAVLAFIAPSRALAGPKAPGTSEPSAPVVIPAGTVAETYVISSPGSYILGGNRSMSDTTKHIIQIAAPDVTVDLNGFALSFPGGTSTEGSGVHIAAVENVAVRNGSIINGITGLYADVGKGLRVSAVRIAGGSTGLHSYAEDTIVEQCQISDASYMGISITGNGSTVNDSVVSGSGQFGIFAMSHVQITGVTVRGGAVGVHIDNFSSLRDSHISDVHGIGLEVTAFAMIHNNHIVDNYGVAVALSHSNDFSGNFVGSTKAFNASHRGVYSGNMNNVLTNNRIISNGTNIFGSYVNGGANILVP
jgi:hypothetical protein